ncbi:cytochrome ubiquinol oxidase subunit I [Chloracidobacterium thermophilum]|jgi:cytochrome d ubiquinol oxidase subunit I|uniref:Cytochrome bd-type quinol oxidase, subunit 1 n=1 Tax=Chloracidobacterium thermophilum (strain B) TaxID=981222 RepID=G2LEK6_CHLTF|nr:cytochrome ubiquinol oxidase subunit I [Chloracidobacterium thermophilum]AEP11669.1 Cytochrome bd-type quinol oxidase, subunit 1 [Chloracidobacterium thermophilum B]QUV79548.1 cytochrome ubiquinol oxidase subunit I [Chloracidobacterium thermophilum]
MNYPFWDVPLIGSGWVIGLIAIFHVMISHFAVGGGFYLPMAEAKALREGREDWLRALRDHARFFIILTGVFGAMSGVGIWFAIGLAHPESTSTLIHNFVFGWAIEWVFFIVELTAAAVYYYGWDKLPRRTHLIVGWIYAFCAWMSLVIINGILTFMLTPGASWLGAAGTGQEAAYFWQAFFNPTYFPSLVLRTLVCISMAGVYALITASRIDPIAEPQLKDELIRWSAKWLLPSFILVPVCFFWYLASVPESQRALLNLGISTIGQGTFTQVTRAATVVVMTSATILAFVYFSAWRNSRHFNLGRALCVLFLAFAATASAEHSREMLRKPFVIGEHMYSNGIRKQEVERFNREGYLANSMWLKTDVPPVSLRQVAFGREIGPETTANLARGELMFRGQCLACHTVEGYRPMARLLQGRDRQAIMAFLKTLHENKPDSPYRSYMPPLVGTPDEIEALADYLDAILNHNVKTRSGHIAQAGKTNF